MGTVLSAPRPNGAGDQQQRRAPLEPGALLYSSLPSRTRALSPQSTDLVGASANNDDDDNVVALLYSSLPPTPSATQFVGTRFVQSVPPSSSSPSAAARGGGFAETRVLSKDVTSPMALILYLANGRFDLRDGVATVRGTRYNVYLTDATEAIGTALRELPLGDDRNTVSMLTYVQPGDTVTIVAAPGQEARVSNLSIAHSEVAPPLYKFASERDKYVAMRNVERDVAAMRARTERAGGPLFV